MKDGNDDKRTGWPRVWKLVCVDRQVVVQKTTEEINVDIDVVGTIWTENFGMTMDDGFSRDGAKNLV